MALDTDVRIARQALIADAATVRTRVWRATFRRGLAGVLLARQHFPAVMATIAIFGAGLLHQADFECRLHDAIVTW